MESEELDALADKVAERLLPVLLKALSVPKTAKRTFAQVDSEAEPPQPSLNTAERTAKVRYWLKKTGRI